MIPVYPFARSGGAGRATPYIAIVAANAASKAKAAMRFDGFMSAHPASAGS
jgi:hypothetical protein